MRGSLNKLAGLNTPPNLGGELLTPKHPPGPPQGGTERKENKPLTTEHSPLNTNH